MAIKERKKEGKGVGTHTVYTSVAGHTRSHKNALYDAEKKSEKFNTSSAHTTQIDFVVLACFLVKEIAFSLNKNFL